MSEINNNDHQKSDELPKSEKKERKGQKFQKKEKGRKFQKKEQKPEKKEQKPEKEEQKGRKFQKKEKKESGHPLGSAIGYLIGTTKNKGKDLLKKSDVKARNVKQVKAIMFRKIQENFEQILEAIGNTMDVEAQKALDEAIAEFEQQQASSETEDADGKPSD